LVGKQNITKQNKETLDHIVELGWDIDLLASQMTAQTDIPEAETEDLEGGENG